MVLILTVRTIEINNSIGQIYLTEVYYLLIDVGFKNTTNSRVILAKTTNYDLLARETHLVLHTTHAAVKDSQHDDSVLFELRYARCTNGLYGAIRAGLSVTVNATPDTNPSSIDSYCASGVGSTTLEAGDLVAIRVTRLSDSSNVCSFTATAVVC